MTRISHPNLDCIVHSQGHWMRTMQGHAAANLVPLVASNRMGKEVIPGAPVGQDVTFYGGR